MNRYPNGNSSGEIGYCCLSICLISVPVYLDSIYTYHQVMFNNKILTLEQSEEQKIFSNYSRWIWHSMLIKIEDILNCEGDAAFTLSMQLLHATDANGNYTTMNDHDQLVKNHLLYSSSSKTHEWELADFNERECNELTSFRSKPFNIDGFDFMFEFIPKQKTNNKQPSKCVLKIHLLRLPLNNPSISILYYLELKEINLGRWWNNLIGRKTLSEYVDLSLYPLVENSFAMDQIKDLNALAFGCDLQIVNVYDWSGNCCLQ